MYQGIKLPDRDPLQEGFARMMDLEENQTVDAARPNSVERACTDSRTLE